MDFGSFDPNVVQIFLLTLIGIIYSTGISWGQEQAGWFNNLSPEWKVRVNAVFTLIVPIAVQWLTPYWRPEFGDLTNITYNVLLLVLPVGYYIWSQIAHAANPLKDKKVKAAVEPDLVRQG